MGSHGGSEADQHNSQSNFSHVSVPEFGWNSLARVHAPSNRLPTHLPELVASQFERTVVRMVVQRRIDLVGENHVFAFQRRRVIPQIWSMLFSSA